MLFYIPFGKQYNCGRFGKPTQIKEFRKSEDVIECFAFVSGKYLTQHISVFRMEK